MARGGPEPAPRLRTYIAGAVALLGAAALPLEGVQAQPLPVWPAPPPWAQPAAAPAELVRLELRQRLTVGSPEVAPFYRARDYRPLWMPGELRPEALDLLEVLRRAGDDGLDPRDYQVEELEAALEAARGGDPRALADAELRLSDGLTAYVADLRRGRGGAKLDYADAQLAPKEPAAGEILQAAAEAPSLGAHFAELRRMNPLYEKLRSTLAGYRARWTEDRFEDLRIRAGAGDLAEFQRAHGLSATGRLDAPTREALERGPAHYEQLILANLERARALPRDFGDRFILVDAAAGRLWLYEDGQVRKTMKVVVGKAEMPTPLMTGVVRQAVFSPYWNVPEDLVQTSIAPKVLSQGLAYIESEGMEVFAGYEEGAAQLDPRAVDWKAVAAGQLSVRVRQRPGPKNMMGKVKLEFPNPLGIFLHDTPMKELFGEERRTASSGCVRLEDAMALTELLMGENLPAAGGHPERRVNLKRPIPVYITYLTVQPTADGLEIRPDVYKRDFPAEQQVAARS